MNCVRDVVSDIAREVEMSTSGDSSTKRCTSAVVKLELVFVPAEFGLECQVVRCKGL